MRKTIFAVCLASQRVLKKAGFISTGTNGGEDMGTVIDKSEFAKLFI